MKKENGGDIERERETEKERERETRVVSRCAQRESRTKHFPSSMSR